MKTGQIVANRFELVQEIEIKNQKTVFIAHDLLMGKRVRVALWRMPDTVIAVDLEHATVLASLKRLQHNSLVSVYDSGFDRKLDVVYAVSEEVRPVSLQDVADRRGTTLAEAQVHLLFQGLAVIRRIESCHISLTTEHEVLEGMLSQPCINPQSAAVAFLLEDWFYQLMANRLPEDINGAAMNAVRTWLAMWADNAGSTNDKDANGILQRTKQAVTVALQDNIDWENLDYQLNRATEKSIIALARAEFPRHSAISPIEPQLQSVRRVCLALTQNLTNQVPIGLNTFCFRGMRGVGKTVAIELTRAWAVLAGKRVVDIGDLIRQNHLWQAASIWFGEAFDANESSSKEVALRLAQHFLAAAQIQEMILFCDDFGEFSQKDRDFIGDLLSGLALQQQSNQGVGRLGFVMGCDFRHDYHYLSFCQRVENIENSFSPIVTDIEPLTDSNQMILLSDMVTSLGGVLPESDVFENLVQQEAQGNPALVCKAAFTASHDNLLLDKSYVLSRQQLTSLRQAIRDALPVAGEQFDLEQLHVDAKRIVLGLSVLESTVDKEWLEKLLAENGVCKPIADPLERLVNRGLIRYDQGFASLRYPGQSKWIRKQYSEEVRRLGEDIDHNLKACAQNTGPLGDFCQLVEVRRAIDKGINPETYDGIQKRLEMLSVSRGVQQVHELWLELASKVKLIRQLNLAQRIALINGLIDRGLVDEALSLKSKVIPTLMIDFDQEVLANSNSLYQLARLFRYSGDFELAEECATRGLKLAKQEDDDELGEQFKVTLATLALSRGNFDDVEELTARDSAKPLTTESAQQLLLLQGHGQRAKRRFNEAEATYKRLQQATEKTGYTLGRANAIQSLALLEDMQGRSEKAQALFQEALHLYESLDHAQGALSCKYTMAQSHLRQIAFDKALPLCKQALVEFKFRRNARDVADALITLGRIQVGLGRIYEGLESLRQALYTGEHHQLEQVKAVSLWELILVEMQAGHFSDVRVHSESFREVADSLQHQRYQTKATALLHTLAFLKAGNQQDAEAAAQAYLAMKEAESEAGTSQDDSVELMAFFISSGVKQLAKLNFSEEVSRFAGEISPWHRLRLVTGYNRSAQSDSSPALPAALKQAFVSDVARISASLAESDLELFETGLNKTRMAAMVGTEEVLAEDADRIEDFLEQIQKSLIGLSGNERPRLLLWEVLKVAMKIPVIDRVYVGYRETIPTDTLTAMLSDGESPEDVLAVMDIFGLKRPWDATKRPYTISCPKDGLAQSTMHTLVTEQRPLDMTSPQVETDDTQEGVDVGSIIGLPFKHKADMLGFLVLETKPDTQLTAAMVSALTILSHQVGVLLYQSLFLKNHIVSRDDDKGSDSSHVYDEIVSESTAMQDLLKSMLPLEDSEVHVVIEGELGSGKELIARSIHATSPRANEKLMVIDCGTLSESLFEALCFGHRKGAFTGAHEDRAGFFEAASGGTLFLDNLTELSLNCQAKLLRVLQEGEVRRVGDLKSIKVDCRILAATTGSLEKLVNEGKFRSDLFYRLNVVHLEIPPLRARQKDIAPLFLRFVANRAGTKGQASTHTFLLDPKASEHLKRYSWPGNVRELQNEAERLVLHHRQRLERGGLITLDLLSPHFNSLVDEVGQVQTKLQTSAQGQGLAVTLKEIERKIIEAALREHQGNMTHTAEKLNLSRDNLRKRMRKLGLDKKKVTQAS